LSHACPANVLLKLTVGIQNCSLHVKPHNQILYIHDTTLCSRW